MKNKGAFWIALVLGLFSMHIIATAALIYFAHTDPGFAVEDDYYEKGVHWDEHRAQLAHNKQLGWRIEVNKLVPKGTLSIASLIVRIEDTDGVPLEADLVTLTLYHNARAADRQVVTLSRAEDGAYHGEARLRRPGWWQLDFEIRRGSDLFTTGERLHVWPAENNR